VLGWENISSSMFRTGTKGNFKEFKTDAIIDGDIVSGRRIKLMYSLLFC